jgi:hypothetical protein
MLLFEPKKYADAGEESLEYSVFSREKFERGRDLSENPLKGSLHNFGGFRKKNNSVVF